MQIFRLRVEPNEGRKEGRIVVLDGFGGEEKFAESIEQSSADLDLESPDLQNPETLCQARWRRAPHGLQALGFGFEAERKQLLRQSSWKGVDWTRWLDDQMRLVSEGCQAIQVEESG